MERLHLRNRTGPSLVAVSSCYKLRSMQSLQLPASLQDYPCFVPEDRKYWVAVKELKLSYYIGETLLLTIYTHYGNLISVP